MVGVLLKPKFLFGHFIVIALSISFLWLASWQLARLDERKELNSKISSHMKKDGVDLERLITGSNPGVQTFIRKNEFNRVVVKGKFIKGGSILILGRSHNQEPGYNVMVPFETNLNGRTALVYINVGYIPTTFGEAITFKGEPLENVFEKINDGNNYTVEGLIRKNESKSLFGNDNQIKKGKTSNRIDVNIFKDQIGNEKLDQLQTSYWIELVKYGEGVKVNQYPAPIDLPELTEKNHFSYALQWLFFSAIILATWGVICFKANRSSKVVKEVNPIIKGK